MLEQTSFISQLTNLTQNPKNHTYLLAVSGGPDSMVMVYLFKGLKHETQNKKFRFEVAHINYKLRGNDSDLDQKIVQDFCEKNHIKFHLYEVSEKDQQPKNSIQLWARELRYAFFKEVQKKEQLEFLVTAHQLNDQLETFIINLSKASGINGLSCIPSNNNAILRPLLNFSKQDIYQFAKEHNIKFREDQSNKTNDYLRNKIRNEVVPILMETNDHFLENFRKSSRYLNQTKDFVQEQVQKIENDLTVLFNKGYKILSKEKLNQVSDFVKFEILKKYGFKREEEIPKIFKAENNSSFFSRDYHLIINRNELLFVEKNYKLKTQKEIVLIEHFNFSENQVSINLGNIEGIDEIHNNFKWNLDAEKILFPLRLRKQKKGDKFYPIGFLGKKKVSKFFRDEKLSILAREKLWILTDRSDAVLGIIPIRQDRRYIMNSKTAWSLKIFNEMNNEI